jgi:hypothetical protein
MSVLQIACCIVTYTPCARQWLPDKQLYIQQLLQRNDFLRRSIWQEEDTGTLDVFSMQSMPTRCKREVAVIFVCESRIQAARPETEHAWLQHSTNLKRTPGRSSYFERPTCTLEDGQLGLNM